MTEDIIITEDALRQTEERCAMLQEKVNEQGLEIARLQEELSNARQYWQALIKDACDDKEKMKDVLKAIQTIIGIALK